MNYAEEAHDIDDGDQKLKYLLASKTLSKLISLTPGSEIVHILRGQCDVSIGLQEILVELIDLAED